MASTALGVADEMELDMFPVEIGDLIENVAAVVVENRDALRGFGDGYQTHREGHGAARICVYYELVPICVYRSVCGGQAIVAPSCARAQRMSKVRTACEIL